MAGHSKWNNIKRVKQAEDSKRNKIFTKLSKDIYNAIKIGGSPDPRINSALKSSIDRAKSFNLSADKISGAINKAAGVRSSDNLFVTKMYEAQFDNGVESLILMETDNPNRSFNDVRMMVNKLEGKLLSEGSILWKFRELYKISIEAISPSQVDELFLIEGLDNLEYDKTLNRVEMLLDKSQGKNIANLYIKFKEISVQSLFLSDQSLDIDLDYIGNIEQEFGDIEDFDSIFFNNKYESFRD